MRVVWNDKRTKATVMCDNCSTSIESDKVNLNEPYIKCPKCESFVCGSAYLRPKRKEGNIMKTTVGKTRVKVSRVKVPSIKTKLKKRIVKVG